MGDPVTIAIAAAAGSSLLSAKAALESGKAQQRANEFNAQVQERNAKVAEQEAEQLRIGSELQIQDFAKSFDRLQASTQQAFRYNGFVATGGTPLRVAMENARQADEEIAMRRYNAAIGQQQALESASQSRMQADLNRLYGRQARQASYYQAGSTLLSGASQGAQIKAFAG
jgi:hypothetical protein